MNRRLQKSVLAWSFGAYALLMLWLLFGQRAGYLAIPGAYGTKLFQNCNLIPFATVAEFLRLLKYAQNPYLVRHALINLAGNVVMFVPLGFFLPCLWKKLRSFLRYLACQLAIVAGVELVQWFTLLGSLDVDDLILNTIGAASGFGLYRFAERRLAARQKQNNGC